MFGVGPIELLFMALAAGILLMIVYRGFRIDESYLTAWAGSAGVRLTGSNTGVVKRYLTWSRRFRTTGALLGWIGVPISFSLVTGEAFPFDNALVLVLAGYLLGAVTAELVFHRPGRGSGAALLVPRKLSDYLPGSVMLLQRALALVSLLFVLVFAASPYPNRTIPQPELVGFAGFGVAGLLVALTIEVLERLVISRRQPVTTDTDVALDDAVRSSSVHVVAGAGIGLQLIILGGEVAVFTPLGGTIGYSLAVLSLSLYVSAIWFWLKFTRPHGFKVRRGSVPGASA